jgi:hypothetical protein
VLEVLEEVVPELLFQVEQRYLNQVRPAYNIARYARGGPKIKQHSAKTRALISAKVRAKPRTPEHTKKLIEHLNRIRKPCSPEHARAMAAKNIGSKRSAETRAKMSAAGLGRPVSEETRAKISASRKGTPSHPWTAESRKRVADAKREWWRQHKK